MNTSSAQTTPGQEDSASESDNTWTQESDIRSLKDTEFDCISIKSDDDDDSNNEEDNSDQKKDGGKKKILNYALNDWKFVCDDNEKHNILVNRFTKFKFDFAVPKGNVCRCKFHLDCNFKIKIVAPNACKKYVMYLHFLTTDIISKHLMKDLPTSNMYQRQIWMCTRLESTPMQ